MLREVLALARAAELAPHLAVRVFAGLIATAGDPDAQLQMFDEAERSLDPGPVCGPCSVEMRINAVLACARSGELVRARRCLSEAEALAGIWQGGPWRAATFEARAALRLGEGGQEQAAGLLLEAAAIYADSGRAVDAQRCEQAAFALGNGAGTLAL
jgi:hypothetical protein